MQARWRSTPLQADTATDLPTLLQASEALTRTSCETIDEALGALRELRRQAGRAVFDIETLKPVEEPFDALSEVTAKTTAAVDASLAVERAVAAVVAATAATYSATLLEFWKSGLVIAPDGDTCPMCDAATLDQARRDELQRRLTAGGESLAATTRLMETSQVAKRAIVAGQDALSRLGAPGISTDERAHLVRLLMDIPEPLALFLAEHDKFLAARGRLNTALTNAEIFVDGCSARLSDPANAPSVVALAVSVRNEIVKAETAIAELFTRYLAHWVEFEPILSRRIASNEVVARIDAIGKALNGAALIALLTRYETILSETQVLIRAVKGHITNKPPSSLPVGPK